MTTAKAWDYAIGLIKVDGIEPPEEFKKYIELEKEGKATSADLKEYLDKNSTKEYALNLPILEHNSNNATEPVTTNGKSYNN